MTIATESSGTPVVAKDGRVFRSTRLLSAFIVPFLLAAFYILYVRTAETGDLFAWRIDAPMTAMMLGTAYMGGAYFFTRAVFAPRWHHISVGFLPVTTFASFMCIATLLHWDRFNQGHISFFAWTILYFTTPFLVFLAWLNNRRTDDGALEASDFRIPRSVRLVITIFGTLYVGIAVLLLINPSGMVELWPWALTPLTARVVGGMFALLGVFGMTIAADGRWSACRIPLQTLMVALVFELLAAIRAWPTFDTSRPFLWVFMATVIGLLVVVPLSYAFIERRLRNAA